VTGGADAAARARVLHALAQAGGAVSLRALARQTAPPDLTAAIAELERAALVETGSDGVVRAGSRGSLLSAADVLGRLRTRRLGRMLEVHAVLGSTNDEAFARSAGGGPPGLTICAELQTAGRGRRGRTFESAPGLGLWCSVVLPVPADPSSAPRLSLAAGLAVCAAVEASAGVRPAVKWPNDVRLSGRKVCGVLVEARSSGASFFAVAGIGINVHHRQEDFPEELRGIAAGLEAMTARGVSRGGLLANLLEALETRLDEEAAGRLDLPSAFAPYDELAGRDVVVETPAGPREGRGAGIARDGALLLSVPGAGTLALSAGDATIRSSG
jgi:BirA family biotin operon repressor/biotin-[acetyl-CoA-carboxylase] ligase